VASHELELLENTGSRRPRPLRAAARPDECNAARSREKLRLAEAAVEMSRYYEDARTLSGGLVCARGAMTLPGRRALCNYLGRRPGIMEAANRGAYEVGPRPSASTSSCPRAMPNPYITPDLNFEFHYFFMRKFWLRTWPRRWLFLSRWIRTLTRCSNC